MQDKIIKKIYRGKTLSDTDYLAIFYTQTYAELLPLMDYLVMLQKKRKQIVTLTPKVFFDENYVPALRDAQSAGFKRVELSFPDDFSSREIISAVKTAQESVDLSLLVPFNFFTESDNVKEILALGIGGFLCRMNVSSDFSYENRFEDPLFQKHLWLSRTSLRKGFSVSVIISNGCSVSFEERLKHFRYLQVFPHISELCLDLNSDSVFSFRKDGIQNPLVEQLKMVLVARIMFPHVKVTCSLLDTGILNARLFVCMGADGFSDVPVSLDILQDLSRRLLPLGVSFDRGVYKRLLALQF